MTLPDNPKPCTTCVHYRPKGTVLWIIPVKLNHPFCTAVRDGQGEPAFAEIERMEAYRGTGDWARNHCGPEGKFHATQYPTSWNDPTWADPGEAAKIIRRNREGGQDPTCQ
jgi:hypothetical protein